MGIRKSGDNTLKAEVAELIYLGDHIRCRLKVEKDDNFIVKVPNSEEFTKLKVSQKTTVSWSTKDCRALDCG